MALAISILARRVQSDGTKNVIAQVTGDSSYPSGGYQLSPSQFGLNTFYPQDFGKGVVAPVILGNGVASGNAQASIFDIDTNAKLHFYKPAATTPFAVELAAAAPANNVVLIIEAEGW